MNAADKIVLAVFQTSKEYNTETSEDETPGTTTETLTHSAVSRPCVYGTANTAVKLVTLTGAVASVVLLRSSLADLQPRAKTRTSNI